MDKKDKVAIVSVKDTIFEFLEKRLGFVKENDTEFSKTSPGLSHSILINGQSQVQQDPDKIIRIEYRGDGKITNTDGTESTIYGFTTYINDIQVGPTNYVDCLEDFKRFVIWA